MGLRQWRRYKATLGVAYHTTPDQMQAFTEGIRALIRANPSMRKDYYIVEFLDFGATSLESSSTASSPRRTGTPSCARGT